MITLNLIPESIREETRLKHVFRLNVRLGSIFIYAIATIAIITVLVRLLLANSYESVSEQAEFMSQNSSAYNQKIKEINEKITVVSQVLEDNHDWGGSIKSIASVLPDGITLSRFQLDKSSKQLLLTGKAASRDDLLQLRNNLNQTGYIGQVELPMSSILEKENISFNISSKFDFVAYQNSKSTQNGK